MAGKVRLASPSMAAGTPVWWGILVACGVLVAACTTVVATPPATTRTAASSTPSATPAATATIAPGAATSSVAPARPALPARSAGCGAGGPDAAGDREVRLIAGGTERWALVHVPTGLDRTKPPALVLSLHGTGSDPADQAWVSGFTERADRNGFIVAYPAGTGDLATWNFRRQSDIPDDGRFIMALLDRLGAELCLDPRRTFLTGFSAGAAMAKVLACAADGRFAGIALVSPVVGPALGDCRQPWPIPTIAFHGLLDPLLPYRGGLNPLPMFADWPATSGVEDWARGWADANGCAGEPVAAEPIGLATELRWQGCSAPLVLWTFGDGGHAWPGGNGFEAFGKINRDVSATDEAWAFFLERDA